MERGLASPDLGGKPVLVNVFASWCVPCLAEHPLLTRLAKEEGIPLYGINYQDRREDALAWLDRHGNPYALVGSDLDARVGTDWGVYAVPGTFFADRDGRVRCPHAYPRHVGRAAGPVRTPLAEWRS